jgi:serine/threonine protein kinase
MFTSPTPPGTPIPGTTHLYESFEINGCQKTVIKCIKKSSCSPESVERQIHILLEISHPGVVHLVGTDETEDEWRLVMLRAIGGDLRTYLRDNGRMTEEVGRRVIYSILKTVRYLHGIGVVHRDIKPENTLMTNDSVVEPDVVLGDFGFARRFAKGEFMNEYLGTLCYMAPEMHRKQPCIFDSNT